jgi:hypothetical protein
MSASQVAIITSVNLRELQRLQGACLSFGII